VFSILELVVNHENSCICVVVILEWSSVTENAFANDKFQMDLKVISLLFLVIKLVAITTTHKIIGRLYIGSPQK